MTMRPKSKVLHSLPRILRSPQQKRIRPRRSLQRQLIKCQALPTRLLDPRSRSRREPQRRDRELGNGKQTVVVGNGADDYDRLVGVSLGGFRVLADTGEPREGYRRTVDTGHEEAAENDFVEGGIGTA